MSPRFTKAPPQPGLPETESSVLKQDGTVWTWGDNWYGQLGDGTYTSCPTPVQPAWRRSRRCSSHIASRSPHGSTRTTCC
jgi:Regulator of chromosome condensation (RCC1) repeat